MYQCDLYFLTEIYHDNAVAVPKAVFKNHCYEQAAFLNK